MIPDKEVKKEFKIIAGKNPDKYYPTSTLKQEGFARSKCKCGTYYWSSNNSKTCGDPACSGGYRFIGKKIAKRDLDYIEVWEEFERLFTSYGYTPISRYPVAARWRDDTDFVQASIYDFQPHVVNGDAAPPAKYLVVPQTCLRFVDIDNVGITGAHYTGFVMIGQHAFVEPKEWDQKKYFIDIYNWLRKGLKLPKKEIIFHEDAWAGGGNFGPCMEFFSNGLELGNQVYMMYEQTPSGHKELKLKVLDMGMGHERNSWFCKGSSTSYETTFPTVCKKLYKQTGMKLDQALIKKFLPYSSYLNFDEVEDIEKAWKEIAKKIGVDVAELKSKVIPLSELYSIGDHSRALLIAISDGALPSNTGGGYNLRYILRRALSFIDKNNWKIDLAEICEAHAEYLKPIFPELLEQLNSVSDVLKVEKEKYENTKKKSREIIKKMIKKRITEEDLINLYDNQGIPPGLVKEEALKLGKEVEIPSDFGSKITAKHLEVSKIKEPFEEKLDLKGIQKTQALYYDDYNLIRFKAKVLKTIGNKVVLDRSAFYATGGGQISDTGVLNGKRVIHVSKQEEIALHEMNEKPKFKVGDKIEGIVDLDRRKQLTQHHTATHIINGACKKVLGDHVWQAGSNVEIDKVRLDITHYKPITEKEVKEIEEVANQIIKEDLTVVKKFMERGNAEGQFGFRLYQGGAVPGKEIRVVEILNFDVEACAGTHLNSTDEAKKIKILKTSKISDSVVRVEFVAGEKAEKEGGKEKEILEEIARILNCSVKEVPFRAEELFSLWKKSRKHFKNKKKIDFDIKLKSHKESNLSEKELLQNTAKTFRTQIEHIPKTAKRFLNELERFRNG